MDYFFYFRILAQDSIKQKDKVIQVDLNRQIPLEFISANTIEEIDDIEYLLRQDMRIFFVLDLKFDPRGDRSDESEEMRQKGSVDGVDFVYFLKKVYHRRIFSIDQFRDHLFVSDGDKWMKVT